MQRSIEKKTALILCAFLGLPLAAWAQPQFSDSTAAAGLNFTLSYGALFDDLINHPEPDANRKALIHILWRNMGNGAAVGDYDQDGDLDVYLLGQLGESNKLFRNNHDMGLKTFTEVTAAPLDDLGMSRSAVFADLNNDGWLDIVLLNDDQRNMDGTSDHPTSKIFRNNGDGSFTDMTPGSGFDPHGYLRNGNGVADFDGDGLVDIYTTVWAGGGTLDTFPRIFPGTNQLFRNLGNFMFEEVTAANNLDGVDRDSFTAIFTDFNNDAAPDIYVAIDHYSDEFYTNDLAGSGTFIDETEASMGLDHVGNDMGVAAADFDDDDDLDLYVTNIQDPSGIFGGSPEANALHINQQNLGGGASFVDEAVLRGVDGTLWGWGTVFTDVENDGDLDILAVNGFDQYATQVETNLGTLPCSVCDGPSFLFMNDGAGNLSRETGTGLDTTWNLGWDSRALIAFDFDRDGDQDYLVTNVAEPAKLVENTTPHSNHYLTVIAEPYALAAGARVYTMASGAAKGVAPEKRRDIIPGRSYMSGFPPEVYFGLGSTTEVDVRVVWADGCTTTRLGVAADQELVIHPLVLEFTSASETFHEEGAPVLLSASGTNCPGTDLDASIEWAETTADNTIGTGATLNASGRSAGTYNLFVTLSEDGASTTIPFQLKIAPTGSGPIFAGGFETGDTSEWSATIEN